MAGREFVPQDIGTQSCLILTRISWDAGTRCDFIGRIQYYAFLCKISKFTWNPVTALLNLYLLLGHFLYLLHGDPCIYCIVITCIYCMVITCINCMVITCTYCMVWFFRHSRTVLERFSQFFSGSAVTCASSEVRRTCTSVACFVEQALLLRACLIHPS